MSINVPTIITVLDAKNHTVSRVVVDYEEVEEVTGEIKKDCELNQWRIKIEVAPTFKVFYQTLRNCNLKLPTGKK